MVRTAIMGRCDGVDQVAKINCLLVRICELVFYYLLNAKRGGVDVCMDAVNNAFQPQDQRQTSVGSVYPRKSSKSAASSISPSSI
jgi:hypothetical protein